MTFSRNIVLMWCFIVFMVASHGQGTDTGKRPYEFMHSTYDGLDNIGPKDGLISYDEIKRALGQTTHEEWKKEIEPHDDGDQLLTVEEFKNWLMSFKKDEL